MKRRDVRLDELKSKKEDLDRRADMEREESEEQARLATTPMEGNPSDVAATKLNAWMNMEELRKRRDADAKRSDEYEEDLRADEERESERDPW